MAINDNLKQALTLSGMIGMLASYGTGHKEFFGPAISLAWSVVFIEKATQQNKTAGTYLSLAGIVTHCAPFFFNTEDLNIGAIVIGATAIFGGRLLEYIEKRQYSRGQGNVNLENHLS